MATKNLKNSNIKEKKPTSKRTRIVKEKAKEEKETAKKVEEKEKVEKVKEKISEVEEKKDERDEQKEKENQKEREDKEEKEGALRYYQGIGRRKSATAQVRLFSKGEKKIIVNNKDYREYFPIIDMQAIVVSPLERMKSLDRFRVEALTYGGGLHAQAEAIKLGIARALVSFNPDYRKRLKKAGFLKRDPREKERKKFGLKRARRAPQWSKR
jgi:small subunit ribosomal protein S9